MNVFEASHVERTHTIRLEAPPSEVFPLFEPLGEMGWADDWEPEILYPATGETVEGAVFVTARGTDEETIWAIASYVPSDYRIRYLRVTPGSRAGVVEVTCEKGSGGATNARVTYAFTALSKAGNLYLAGFTEEYYRGFIDSWEVAIARALRDR
jgi:hypothetical protein